MRPQRLGKRGDLAGGFAFAGEGGEEIGLDFVGDGLVEQLLDH